MKRDKVSTIGETWRGVVWHRVARRGMASRGGAGDMGRERGAAAASLRHVRLCLAAAAVACAH